VAPYKVAARIVSSGGMPPSTMYWNSFALSPCGATPWSVPNAIFTPARYARENVPRICGPIASALGRTTSGKKPGAFALSATNFPAEIVGTYHVPCCFMRAMASSSM
jgi:hypothetical protein